MVKINWTTCTPGCGHSLTHPLCYVLFFMLSMVNMAPWLRLVKVWCQKYTQSLFIETIHWFETGNKEYSATDLLSHPHTPTSSLGKCCSNITVVSGGLSHFDNKLLTCSSPSSLILFAGILTCSHMYINMLLLEVTINQILTNNIFIQHWTL